MAIAGKIDPITNVLWFVLKKNKSIKKYMRICIFLWSLNFKQNNTIEKGIIIDDKVINKCLIK